MLKDSVVSNICHIKFIVYIREALYTAYLFAAVIGLEIIQFDSPNVKSESCLF